jgi:hypothetical protein
MSCDCAQCRQHYRTLGIAYGIPTETEIEDAYREGVKQWHPDLYENYASLRADAEEHFKQLQVAYRELKEHSGGAVTEAPIESVVVEPKAERPLLSFGGAPGCEVGPHFSPEAEEILSHHLGRLGMALAMVDLSGSRAGGYAQFLLLAELGMMVRDARKIVTLLWYKDLGEIKLMDKQKTGLWQSLVGGGSGSQTKCALEIYRSNGTLFTTITGQAEESVKRVLYDVLERRKELAQH